MRISRYVSSLGLAAAVTLMMAGSVLSFCIFTNDAGLFRKYIDSDIPFIYRPHVSTPDSYMTRIDMAADRWTNVPSAYWVFERGELTGTSRTGRDYINLVFFDFQGVNFPPPTNVIAFSRTYTTTAGGYRALESDLVWNARDFPPSPSGQPGLIDLQGTMAHEFGHHLGLGHQGSPGSPPGCGPTITQAVMYGLATRGDTTHRHLHIHDIAGVSVIYPIWVLYGTITVAGTAQAIGNAEVRYIGTNAASIGPVETPPGTTTFERPGLVVTTEYTNSSGAFRNVVLDQSFQVVVAAYGYLPDTASASFDPPGGIGATQFVQHNVALQRRALATLSGIVRDRNSSTPIPNTKVELRSSYDPTGEPVVVVHTNAQGIFSAALPGGETFSMVLYPPIPYPDSIQRSNIYLDPTGVTLDFALDPAQVFLVCDDSGSSYLSYYHEILDDIWISRRTHNVSVDGVPTLQVLNLFPRPRIMFWYTGDPTTGPLTADESSLLIGHLENAGSLFLTGQNIAEYAPANDPLITEYFGVEFTSNATGFAANTVRGFSSDPVGNGLQIAVLGGAANQSSKDQLTLTGTHKGDQHKVLYYGSDTTRLAAVRVQNAQSRYKAVFAGFGAEGIGNRDRRKLLFERVVAYLSDTSFVVSVRDDFAALGIPSEFTVEQNYPNPFNPSTTIRVGLPEQASVTVRIVNTLGQTLRLIPAGELTSGHHEIVWDGKNEAGSSVASGLYFFRVEAHGASGTSYAKTRKMLMMK